MTIETTYQIGHEQCLDQERSKRSVSAVASLLEQGPLSFDAIFLILTYPCPKDGSAHVLYSVATQKKEGNPDRVRVLAESAVDMARTLRRDFGPRRDEGACCRCGETAEVLPRWLPSTHYQGPQPIRWRCEGCDRPVCFNCALTVPHSVPRRFYERTWCSQDCRQACEASDEPAVEKTAEETAP